VAVREHEIEPVPGLPENLPAGEEILWQGAPSWKGMAIRVLHVRAVAIYFALLFASIAGSAVWSGVPYGKAMLGNIGIVAGGVAACALLCLFAWLMQRSTLYTITTRRVVMRFGIALPMSANIPFAAIHSADLKLYSDGSGDIALSLAGPSRQSLVVLWPHVRPWHTVRPQPALRCVPNAREVAETLATAMTVVAHRKLPLTEKAKPDAMLVPIRESAAA
jgi:Bacterial PH domain